MRTITFYSYKGGVGRSLALSNIAIRLSQLNKKVCVIDFDLDAPGLQFKFKDYNFECEIKKGIVDYIYEFSVNENIPAKIKDHSIRLNPKNKNFEPITFISAGDIDSTDYWRKLSQIRWADMFYGDNAQGVSFFLDLKAKIEKEIAPDVLLIDSRTGITDISGITLRIFADEVVVLAANNEENIFGCKKIIKGLLKPDGLFNRIPKLNFVLTRLPFTDSPSDKGKEFQLINKLTMMFKSFLSVESFDISTIHSDRRLEESESTLIGHRYEEEKVSISNDYLKLFDLLTHGLLTKDEIGKFSKFREAENEYHKAISEQDSSKKLVHITKAIMLDDQQSEYFRIRAEMFWDLGNYDLSINDYLKILDLNPNDNNAFLNLGDLHGLIKQHSLAIDYLDRVDSYSIYKIDALHSKAGILKQQNKKDEAMSLLSEVLIQDPNYHDALNDRADIFRCMGDYESALQDIYKAIEVAPKEAVYFGTLAEICADEGNMEAFYLNLTIALSNGLLVENMQTAKDVYEKFRHKSRFITLMKKYDIDIEAIFAD